MSRPALQPWECPLCKREVRAVYLWKDRSEEGGECAIYYHAHQEQCCVANHNLTVTVSQIVDHGFPGKTPEETI